MAITDKEAYTLLLLNGTWVTKNPTKREEDAVEYWPTGIVAIFKGEETGSAIDRAFKLSEERSEVAEGEDQPKITCNDCTHCGEIVDTFPESEGGLKKHCPPEYFFDHPNAKDCSNFKKKEA